MGIVLASSPLEKTLVKYVSLKYLLPHKKCRRKLLKFLKKI